MHNFCLIALNPSIQLSQHFGITSFLIQFEVKIK